MFKAASGRGKGAYNVSDTKNVDEESKFVEEMFNQRDENIQLRKSNAQKFVDSFYTIATDFYESGWGQSFHFAPRGRNETFRESIIRHEHHIALKLNIQPDDIVLDVGCGIGGPMRNIAQFTGAKIIGVTINEYQVNRGNEINKAQGFADQCLLQKGDFCKLSAFKDNTFDKIFAIEATCHSPNRCDVYDQVYRVLKPGGLFASYEWVLNEDKFDAENAAHLQTKYEIEKGNALPDLISDKDCLECFKQSGFDVIECSDLDQTCRNKGQIAWHASLLAKCSVENIQHTYCGAAFTHYLTWFLEKVWLAPKGTFRTHEILQVARKGLCQGGETQIFTPMFLVIGEKPKLQEQSI
jgi:sterol 24-C-methyltransferase